MSVMRKRRLERLEARQPSAPPWTDPYDLCMSLWAAFQAETAATKAGRPFSRLPEPELGPDSEAFVLAMKDADRMHARLTAERA